MMPVVSFTVFFFFFVLIQECRASCALLAGTETDISCSDSTRSDGGLLWRAEVEGEIMDVANCISPGSCVSLYPDNFVASLNGSRSYLTIKSASRTHPFNMDTRWFCTYHKDKYNRTACSNLYVLEESVKPTCGPMSLNATTLQLSITCSTERVYPQAYCQFVTSRYKNDSWTSLLDYPTYDHTELNETLEYYRTECSFEIPLERFRSYGMFYSIRMYPKYGSSTQNAVYTNTKEIKVALVDDQEDDDDNDVLFILVIVLGAALGVAVLAVVVLAIVVCRNKHTRELGQTRKIPKQKKETRPVKDISRPQTTKSSTSGQKHYDHFNTRAQNPAYVEEDETYEEVGGLSTTLSTGQQGGEIYEN